MKSLKEHSRVLFQKLLDNVSNSDNIDIEEQCLCCTKISQKKYVRKIFSSSTLKYSLSHITGIQVNFTHALIKIYVFNY